MYGLKDERWLKNLNQLKTVENKVVLTFDDGPSRQLNQILDILKEKNVQAIFFWQSKLFYDERPWKRVVAEGHLIGSHAYNHKNLTKLNKEQQFEQIKYSIDKMERIIKTKIRYFRPPFGQYNEDTMDILKDFCLVPIMWEITSFDWEHKNIPKNIVENVVENVKNGSIILMHELTQTVSVLPQMIDGIHAKGFEFTLF
ncbi:MAG TPA: polysaccharide deacetylase family protein [Bacillus bacterium]|nr:polysaccharide deacetylase family protein [Bacillus sp. (in: firmicutes)]